MFVSEQTRSARPPACSVASRTSLLVGGFRLITGIQDAEKKGDTSSEKLQKGICTTHTPRMAHFFGHHHQLHCHSSASHAIVVALLGDLPPFRPRVVSAVNIKDHVSHRSLFHCSFYFLLGPSRFCILAFSIPLDRMYAADHFPPDEYNPFPLMSLNLLLLNVTRSIPAMSVRLSPFDALFLWFTQRKGTHFLA